MDSEAENTTNVDDANRVLLEEADNRRALPEHEPDDSISTSKPHPFGDWAAI